MLEIDGLERRFGDVVALDGVSFDVRPCEMVGFVGSNGAGKTTAMRIVMGVDEPDAGEVRWDGRRVDDAQRARFGYMPEERGLYPKMAADRQLAYLARLHGVDRASAFDRARSWIDRLGLADRGGEPVENLSQGNQQRIQLAAALVHEPPLLVLDEPFSGLDPVGVDVMASILLERVADGAAVVFSSHQLELVEELCDAVAIIDRGRLVATGTVDELRTRGRPVTYRVRLEGGGESADWPDDLPTRQEPDGAVVVEVPDGQTDRVLDAARAAGRVIYFAPVVPRLSELYREVVSPEGTDR